MVRLYFIDVRNFGMALVTSMTWFMHSSPRAWLLNSEYSLYHDSQKSAVCRKHVSSVTIKASVCSGSKKGDMAYSCQNTRAQNHSAFKIRTWAYQNTKASKLLCQVPLLPDHLRYDVCLKSTRGHSESWLIYCFPGNEDQSCIGPH